MNSLLRAMLAVLLFLSTGGFAMITHVMFFIDPFTPLQIVKQMAFAAVTTALCGTCAFGLFKLMQGCMK